MRKKNNVKFTIFVFILLIALFPSQSFGAWTAWQGIDGWIGLDYRLQSKPRNNGEWEFKIQFRNRYSQRINFNVNVKNGRGNGRIHIGPDKKQKFSGFFTKDNFIMFIIEKVRFGEDSKMDGYAQPDE